jgi:hypothetical protein
VKPSRSAAQRTRRLRPVVASVKRTANHGCGTFRYRCSEPLGRAIGEYQEQQKRPECLRLVGQHVRTPIAVVSAVLAEAGAVVSEK